MVWSDFSLTTVIIFARLALTEEKPQSPTECENSAKSVSIEEIGCGGVFHAALNGVPWFRSSEDLCAGMSSV